MTMRNAMTLEKAAVYAVSQDTALTRLHLEYMALLNAKRYGEAQGARRAMNIVRHLDTRIIPKTEWEERRR